MVFGVSAANVDTTTPSQMNILARPVSIAKVFQSVVEMLEVGRN